MPTAVQMPFECFLDTDGTPLNDGKIYIGTVNLNPITSPITVYWDSALTIPASQPIRTLGGVPSMTGTAGNLYVSGSYSIIIRNKDDETLFSQLNVPASQGAGSGFIAEGVQSIQITDLNFDPTLLGLATGETRVYYTSLNPANPWGGYTGYYALTLTKETATEFRVIGQNGTSLFSRTYSSGWSAPGIIPGQFDFIVNSSAALAQWRSGGGGFTYTRVYVAPGSWSVDCSGASGNALAGEGINLTLAGTKLIVGSVGSLMTFNNQSSSSTKGSLFYTSVPSTPDYSITGVSISQSTDCNGIYGANIVANCQVSITTSAATIGGFVLCNVVRESFCSITVSGASQANGFFKCGICIACDFSMSASGSGTIFGYQGTGSIGSVIGCSGTYTVPNTTGTFVFASAGKVVSGCNATINGGTLAAQAITGIIGGGGISGCTITITSGSATGSNIGITGNGVSSCSVTMSGAATSNIGFSACARVTACTASISAGTTATGFGTSSNLTSCVSNVTGGTTQRGFSSCIRMGFNFVQAATTAYNACFADTATNPAAATAAGGYNI